MIFQAIKLISIELNNFLDSFGNISEDMVVLGNIAQLDGHSDNPVNLGAAIENKIVMTLVNLQEEKTLRNTPAYIKNNLEVEYQNPPIHLNLFVLFSASATNYENALVYLSRVIAFFQGKSIFNNANTPIPAGIQGMTDLDSFKFIVDLYSLTFEESNHLWATLGGKQLPSVLYKIRLSVIDRKNITEVRPAVQEIIFDPHTMP